MVTTVSDVCNVSNVQLHVLIKKNKKKISFVFHCVKERTFESESDELTMDN